jgi:hypothetical protein
MRYMIPLQECSGSVSFLSAVHNVEHWAIVSPKMAPFPMLRSLVLMLSSNLCGPAPGVRSKSRRPEVSDSFGRISARASLSWKFSCERRSRRALTAWCCSRCCWMYSSSSDSDGASSAPEVPPLRSFCLRRAVSRAASTDCGVGGGGGGNGDNGEKQREALTRSSVIARTYKHRARSSSVCATLVSIPASAAVIVGCEHRAC